MEIRKDSRGKIVRIHITRTHSLAIFGLILMSLGTAALAEDVGFHWNPSPAVNIEGEALSLAVEYQVWLEKEGQAEVMAGTVRNTEYVLDVEPGVVHRIRVCGVDAQGRRSPMSDWSDPVLVEEERSAGSPPLAPTLPQNYPNPFNPETRIVYGVPADVAAADPVRLDIYDLSGTLVRTMDVDRTPGWHEVTWDGTDFRGNTAATGMYVSRLVVGTLVHTRKMTMLK